MAIIEKGYARTVENIKKRSTGIVEQEIDNFKYRLFNKNDTYESTKIGKGLINKSDVFTNKEDKTKIRVQENRIKFDNTPDNITSALDIAEDKGWKTIKIKARDKRVAQQIWYEAQMRGMETKGYKPTRYDLNRLEVSREQNQDEALNIQPRAPDKHQHIDQQEEIKKIVNETAKSLSLNEQQRKELLVLVNEKIENKSIDTASLPEKSAKIRAELPAFKENLENGIKANVASSERTAQFINQQKDKQKQQERVK